MPYTYRAVIRFRPTHDWQMHVAAKHSVRHIFKALVQELVHTTPFFSECASLHHTLHLQLHFHEKLQWAKFQQPRMWWAKMRQKCSAHVYPGLLVARVSMCLWEVKVKDRCINRYIGNIKHGDTCKCHEQYTNFSGVSGRSSWFDAIWKVGDSVCQLMVSRIL